MLGTTPTQAIAEQEPAVASDDERAALLGSLEEFEQALAVSVALIVQHPQESLAYVGKGNMLQLLKQPEAALGAYSLALTLAPALSPAWIEKACALKALPQDQAALEAYDQAPALDATCASLPPLASRKRTWNAIQTNGHRLRWC